MPIKKSAIYAFFLRLMNLLFYHLQHLQSFTPTYTPARNPHLHTYPPFKGGKCEWWGGGHVKRYNFTQEVQAIVLCR
jgi:hypothetical protein